MKKNSILLCTVVMLFVYAGCTKQGPVGPAGPAGPTGPTGLTTTIVDTFSIASNSWVTVQTSYYKFVHSDVIFTQKVVDVGSVEVYVKNSSYPDWFGMPNVVAGGAGFRFSYGVGSITIYADNFNGTISSGLRNYFKVIIKQ